MRSNSVITVLPCLVMALAVAMATPKAVYATEEELPSAAPFDVPALEKSSQPRRITAKTRREALESLYEQLSRAPNEESAELIVSAIEKMWRRSESDTVNILMERASMALQAKKQDLAVELLTALTQVAPTYVEGWNQLATIHFMKEDFSDAMQQLRHVLSLDPRHFKAIEGMSIILREVGKKKAALRVLRKALEVNPHLKSAKQAEEELAREIEGQGI